MSITENEILQTVKTERLVLETARRLGFNGDPLAEVRSIGTMSEQNESVDLFGALPKSAKRDRNLAWALCKAVVQSSGCNNQDKENASEEGRTFVGSVSATPSHIERKIQRERGVA